MGKKLIEELADCNLKAAAFDLAKGLGSGVYENEMASALDLFNKLPCPETALILINVCPEALELIVSASNSSVRTIPKEDRGPKLEGFEEWMDSFDSNLRTASCIQSFLSKEVTAGHVMIGFHRMRDQEAPYHRLAVLGIKKSFFTNRRNFLRMELAKNPSAFRAVIDMICIHGIHDGKEVFWNGLGGESDGQYHLQSEVMFEISEVAGPFTELLNDGIHH